MHCNDLVVGAGMNHVAAKLSVSGLNGFIAAFTCNGDGQQVAQTINNVTTYFVGNYYEKTGSTVTKYYYAGGVRVAVRTGSTVYYLLGDHPSASSGQAWGARVW
jgi:hypothetical protein